MKNKKAMPPFAGIENGAAQPRSTCAAAAGWLAANRDDRAAHDCLSAGAGAWTLGSAAPYLLEPSTRERRRERKWWGRCDADILDTDSSTPPRARDTARRAALYEWMPLGTGCAELRKQRHALPSMGVLACAFCKRWAGKSILFVGDESQAQFFQSFAHIVGGAAHSYDIRDSRIGQSAPRGVFDDENRACRRADGSVVDVEMTLCARGESGVRIRFIRNELLDLDNARNAARRRPKGARSGTAVEDRGAANGLVEAHDGGEDRFENADGTVRDVGSAEATTRRERSSRDSPISTNKPPTQPRLPNLLLCEWDRAARQAADLIVLNRGYHSTGTAIEVLRFELNQTMHTLDAHLKQHRQGAQIQRTPPMVVYRGTHASLHRCADHSDPITRNASGSVHPVTHALRLHRSNSNAHGSWHNLYAHHRLDQDLMSRLGVPYLNVFTATSLRPGGRLHPTDCARFCLPGPIDEWTRLLLASIT